MAAAEGEKKGAMEADEEEKQAMAPAKGAPVEGKGAAAPEEEVGEAAPEKRKEAAEAKGVDGVKMITLRSADGEERSMPPAAAKMSVALSHMIEDASRVEDAIRIQHCATGRTLSTVIDYCVKHTAEPVNDYYSDDPSGAEDLEKWDRKLVEGLSADDLFDLLLAANYLCIRGLLDVVCQRAADMIKGKTTQQIRDTFNLTNDLTPADEAELRWQYAWSFDG